MTSTIRQVRGATYEYLPAARRRDLVAEKLVSAASVVTRPSPAP